MIGHDDERSLSELVQAWIARSDSPTADSVVEAVRTLPHVARYLQSATVQGTWQDTLAAPATVRGAVVNLSAMADVLVEVMDRLTDAVLNDARNPARDPATVSHAQELAVRLQDARLGATRLATGLESAAETAASWARY